MSTDFRIEHQANPRCGWFMARYFIDEQEVDVDKFESMLRLERGWNVIEGELSSSGSKTSEGQQSESIGMESA